MKRVKVLVPVILQIYGDSIYELELNENSCSSEIEYLESEAFRNYENGAFDLLSEENYE